MNPKDNDIPARMIKIGRGQGGEMSVGMLADRTHGAWLWSCPLGSCPQPQPTPGDSQEDMGRSWEPHSMGIRVRHKIRKVITWLCTEQLVSSQNFRSRLWPCGFRVFPKLILFPAVAPGNPKWCPRRWAAGWTCCRMHTGMSQELFQGLKGLINTQPQLVAISQVPALAAVKPSDRTTSPTGVGLILAWRRRWKKSCLFCAQLHSDLVMISCVFLEI